MNTLKYIFYNRRNPWETLEFIGFLTVFGAIVYAGVQLVQW